MIGKRYTAQDIATMSPVEYRLLVRRGDWVDANRTACHGYAHAGLIALPREYAADFMLFCHRNPLPCPVYEVTEPGDPHPKLVAQDCDLSTDLPRYRVFVDGKVVDEPTKATRYWRDDLVAFVMGCSRGIDDTITNANIRSKLVGIYNSNIPLEPAGIFWGNMTVSCRAFASSRDAIRAIQLSSRYPAYHGAPVHIGDPKLIGINDISKVDFPVPHGIPEIKDNEIGLFWGCSVTPQNIAEEVKVPYMIAQYQGCLLVTDKRIDEMAVI